jgi:hypothetical protein
LGIIALKKIRKNPELSGETAAIVGIVIGSIMTFLALIGALAYFGVFSPSASEEQSLQDASCNLDEFKCGDSCFSCPAQNVLCCNSAEDNWCCPSDYSCDYTNKDCKLKSAAAYCGDKICQKDESCSDCEKDCGPCETESDTLEKIKKSIVYVRYDYTGKDADGTYFEKTSSGSGVIIGNEKNFLRIYTNRHAVDCGYTDNCFQRISELIKVRTQDGKMHTVSSIAFFPHNLDIAQLEINTAGYESYGIPTYANEVSVGENVIAIGYPSYADRVLEFSVAEGKISKFKDLLMDDGFAFNSIESDAYTYFGSSGGGLFDSQGNRVGINTWADSNGKRSIAIKLSVLGDISSLEVCKRNSYPNTNHLCMPYCERTEVLGQDGQCYGLCDEFYCNSKIISGSDSRCNNGYIAGDDGYCHPPCSSYTSYCADPQAICYQNRCILCRAGTHLFKDGTCRIYS